MVFEWDDFGCNHEISNACQSHDCRDQLYRLKEVNPAFKATLFTIPAEVTVELLNWRQANANWIEFAVHGFTHSSNWECNEWTYDQMDNAMKVVQAYNSFVKVFRAPGWQISSDCFKWLLDHNWVVADQSYNDDRRPLGLRAYINNNGEFRVSGRKEPVEAYHGHTWNVGAVGSDPNGIYEDFDKVEKLVKEAKEFKFVSELFLEEAK